MALQFPNKAHPVDEMDVMGLSTVKRHSTTSIMPLLIQMDM